MPDKDYPEDDCANLDRLIKIARRRPLTLT